MAGLTEDLLFMEDIFPVCHPRLLGGERKLSHPEAAPTPYFAAYDSTPARLGAMAKGRRLDCIGSGPDSTTMAIHAAEAGLGVAITRETQIADTVKKGSLVVPFRRDLLQGEGCYFLTRPERRDEPQVVAFRSWLLEEASQLLGK